MATPSWEIMCVAVRYAAARAYLERLIDAPSGIRRGGDRAVIDNSYPSDQCVRVIDCPCRVPYTSTGCVSLMLCSCSVLRFVIC
jgi:hypothetical protein